MKRQVFLVWAPVCVHLERPSVPLAAILNYFSEPWTNSRSIFLLIFEVSQFAFLTTETCPVQKLLAKSRPTPAYLFLGLPTRNCSKISHPWFYHGLPRSGRPPKMSLYHFDYIDKRMVQNDELTAKELACDFLNAFGLKISVPAMNKIRNKLGWRKAGTKYCQVVSEKNRTSRLHLPTFFTPTLTHRN